MGSRKPLIISTANSQYFADLIGAQIGAEVVPTTRKRFGGSELYLKLEVADRLSFVNRDVVIVGSGSNETDPDFEEVCRTGTAVAKYGARGVFYVMPFAPYARMERAVKPGEVVTAKIVARRLSQLPKGRTNENTFLHMDLHTAGYAHYYEGNCLALELYAEDILDSAFEQLGLQDFMFASADLGRPRWVKSFAKRYRTKMAFVDKNREFDRTEVYEVVGDVEGKIVVIYDDMIASGGTLIGAAKAYLQRGAVAVYAIASHLAPEDEAAINRLIDSPIVKIISTNTHPMSQHPLVKASKKFIVEDASRPFADMINVLNGG